MPKIFWNSTFNRTERLKESTEKRCPCGEKMTKKNPGKGKTKVNTYEVFDGLKAMRILYSKKSKICYCPTLECGMEIFP